MKWEGSHIRIEKVQIRELLSILIKAFQTSEHVDIVLDTELGHIFIEEPDPQDEEWRKSADDLPVLDKVVVDDKLFDMLVQRRK